VAHIVAFVPDLLFGSNVVGALQAAGHEVQLVSALSPETDADLVVIDLTAEPDARIAAAEQALKPETPKLAFYSHVEADVRAKAVEAGFDLVVPRSRMAREGAALVDQLLQPSA
jgi:nucleoside-diphosphate-sugar epimerase